MQSYLDFEKPVADLEGKIAELKGIADELGCSLAQLSLAWCVKNENVSTTITGASRPEQVVDNFGALDVLPKLTDELYKQMGEITSRR